MVSMEKGFARLWAHIRHDERDARRLFPDAALDRIERAVTEGERRHRAEVRLAIEASLPLRRVLADTSPRERAIEVFGELKVWDTEANNGVLLYLLLADHAIELVADRGASAVLRQEEMDRICKTLHEAFRRGHYEHGVLAALATLNDLLAEAFPALDSSVDEDELLNRPAIL
jgi:uncharacterized membrane protein